MLDVYSDGAPRWCIVSVCTGCLVTEAMAGRRSTGSTADAVAADALLPVCVGRVICRLSLQDFGVCSMVHLCTGYPCCATIACIQANDCSPWAACATDPNP